MRSVEGLRFCVTAAALALLAGCASRPVTVAPPETAPAAATAKATAVSAQPATAAPETAAAPPKAAPLSAATRRAFDDAVALLRAGRVEAAEAAFKALVAADPTLGGAHANLGLIHRRAGRAEQAVAAFEAAVKASPTQSRWWNQLGIAHREAGHFAKAREAYEQALAIDPQFAGAHMNLGVLNDLYLGNTAQALVHYMRCAELSPAEAPKIDKWVAELKARKPAVALAVRKEKE
jgi:tetratricopeptide (TPR) repeat protein